VRAPQHRLGVLQCQLLHAPGPTRVIHVGINMTRCGV
jgi:hypothetical protein